MVQFLRGIKSRIRRGDPAGELMRSEWDVRALENARYYIASDDWESDDEFEESGETDVRAVLSDIEPHVKADSSVLEIGCGIGRMTIPLAKRFSKVYAVDVSPEMIRMAKARTRDHKNITLWANNGRDLRRLPAKHVDLVLSYVTLQHVPSREAIMSYINDSYRVLRPGGIFKFQVHGREDTPESAEEEAQAERTTWRGVQFTEHEIVAATEAAGFRVLRSYHLGVMYLWVIAVKPS
jgi:cyclopropane fatty-acyl-phospholipid synthase-like methyltransferase